jgi:hypothetical protein
MHAAARFAFGASLLLLATHVAARATRDALFLSNFPVTVLPRMMIAAAVVTLVGAVIVSRLLARVRPTRLVPAGFVLSAAFFVGEWFLLRAAPRAGAVAVYLHFAGFSAVLMSGFWSVVNERFDPHTGKAVVTRIGIFGALGGVVGGLAAFQLAPLVGAPAMLLGLAVLHLGAGAGVLGIGPPAEGAAARSVPQVTASGLRILRRTPLLLQMAALIALLGIIEELIDYAFKAEAAARYRDEASLVEFFALFYTAANALAFALQTAAGRHVLQRLGLGGAMALLPALVALSATAATLVTRLWTVTLARGANAVLALSFFRSGFELLYTPVPPETKRPAKAYIDVAAFGLGHMTGGLLILGLLLLIPDLPTQVVLMLVVAACLGGLALVGRLHRGYVRLLADNLRSGVISLDQEELTLDGTTASTLTDTRVTIDRAELRARLRDLEPRAGTPGGAAAPDQPPGAPTPELAAHLEQVTALASSDRARVRATLAEARGDPRLLSHVLPLLDRFDVEAEALRFLRELAPRCVGQLTDALLDDELGIVARRRVPRALEAGGGPRAIEGLCLGLESDDFDMRLQCGRAAARLVARHSELALARDRVFAFAERELGVDPRTWEHQGRRRAEAPGESVVLEVADLDSVNRSVEHVFTLLGMTFGPEVMGSTLRALYCADANLRGTALEYLQAVLPERVRRSLWPHIPAEAGHRRPGRSTEQIEDELLRSSVAIRLVRNSG